jgi:hypothetical protein
MRIRAHADRIAFDPERPKLSEPSKFGFICQYVRGEKTLTLPEALAKSDPSCRTNRNARTLDPPGLHADLIASVTKKSPDRTTWKKPLAASIGILKTLAKITLVPARRLDERIPAIRNKGRSRPGVDPNGGACNPEKSPAAPPGKDSPLPPASAPTLLPPSNFASSAKALAKMTRCATKGASRKNRPAPATSPE